MNGEDGKLRKVIQTKLKPAKHSTLYTSDNADLMTLAGGVSYGYDNNGNQTSRASDSFTWDHENRLKTASIGGAAEVAAGCGRGAFTGPAVLITCPTGIALGAITPGTRVFLIYKAFHLGDRGEIDEQ